MFKKNGHGKQATYPKIVSYINCFFNPVSKTALKESLDKAQNSINRADDLIKKSDDLNMQVNQFLSNN